MTLNPKQPKKTQTWVRDNISKVSSGGWHTKDERLYALDVYGRKYPIKLDDRLYYAKRLVDDNFHGHVNVVIKVKKRTPKSVVLVLELDGKKVREFFFSDNKEMIGYSVEEALEYVFGQFMVDVKGVDLKHETSDIIVVKAEIKNKRLLQ